MRGAVIGALAASAALALATALNPSIVIDFDADVSRPVASGFYPAERSPEETFAWTAALATVTLRGVDRDVPWRCSVRMRGARPPGLPEPQAAFGIDGLTVETEAAGLAYRDIEIVAPPSPRARSLSLTISTSPTFVPGPADTRELGVQVDRIACAPVSRAVQPPLDALIAAATSGAAFGALLGVLSGAWIAAGATVLFAAALAFVLTTGMAMYSPAYVDRVIPIALWIACPVLLAATVRFAQRRVVHPAGAFVLAFSSAILFLKLVALMHPSKEIVDAVFHAHRFDGVLAGNYYFTQPMPGGVRFPYAIGLYVTASPFARLVPDHVALLRIVVCLFEAAAAALLYVAIAKSWKEPVAGAFVVVLYYAAPLPYLIIGNANLTFAFAQSIGVITLVAAAVLPFQHRTLASVAAFILIVSLGFLSHVGVFPVLAASLLALGVLYLWRGGADLRVSAWCVLASTVLAAAFAIGIYYAHFPEVWSTLDRVSAPVVSQGSDSTSAGRATPAPLPVAQRATRAAVHGVRAYGAPLAILALPGLWLVWRGTRDRLTLAFAAWAVGFAVFLLFRIVAPVDARLQRYADEFIDRLYYATLPVVAILAARAAAAGWRRGSLVRWSAVTLVVVAFAVGARRWIDWIR